MSIRAAQMSVLRYVRHSGMKGHLSLRL